MQNLLSEYMKEIISGLEELSQEHGRNQLIKTLRFFGKGFG